MLMLHISGETPSKKNSRVVNTKTGRNFPNRRYTQWEKEKLLEVGRQYRGKPLEGPLTVSMTFRHKNRRVRDCDNPVNSVMDMLKKAGVIKDDRWTVIPAHSVRHELADGEGCEIVISEGVGL